MNVSRRIFLKAGGSLGAVLLLAGWPRWASADEAWNAKAFAGKSLDDVVKALGGNAAQPSADVMLTAPDIAENGAVVPVEIESKLLNTRSISILVEKNPNALSADFSIPAGTDPYISTRVKMAETSNLYALVQTDQGFFYAKKEVKVTLGGCGG
jgi:sulfur-oxidizing protein SoxY